MRKEQLTCNWKFRNFSCEIELLKDLWPWTLISRLSSFLALFEESSNGHDRFSALILRLEEGRGLLGIILEASIEGKEGGMQSHLSRNGIAPVRVPTAPNW
jgi:hypothetical protein